MPHYYFSITSEQPFDDIDGLELPDLAAAREEAIGFALDLMRLEPSRHDWLGWVVRVTGEDQEHLFEGLRLAGLNEQMLDAARLSSKENA